MRKRAGKQGIRALRPAPSEEAPTERRQKNKPGQQRCRETEQQSAKQMIVGEGQSYGLEKKWVDKRYPATTNKKMECPASFHLLEKWPGIQNVGMRELPMQQAQEPTANQSNICAAGNADLRSVSFGNVHENGTDYAAEKRPD